MKVMKKKELFITLIFAVLLTGCIHDCITDPPAGGNTITITAGLPGESASTDMPGTMIALKESGLNVNLTWEVGDQIYLVLTQGGAYKDKQTYTLTADDISDDKKKAVFTLSLAKIADGNFNLYGVYGGEGLDGTDPTKAKLPLAEHSRSSSLDSLQKNKGIMLTFAKPELTKPLTSLSVNFEHIGSLFRILVKNTAETSLNDVNSATLTADDNLPVYCNDGNDTYDLDGVDGGRFTSVGSNSLSFAPISSSNIVSGGILAFWAWFPVQKEQTWQELKLTVGGKTTEGTTSDKTGVTVGKAYHFYATHNGTTLSFAGSTDITVAAGKLADFRDGNLYNTVEIKRDDSTQTWMKENLAYLPSVVAKATGSEDSGLESNAYYYVYGNTSTDVATAKATTNYTTYGVLYNWTAAMAGAASSNERPSGIRGACPNGWHLPSDAEWKQLERALGMLLTETNKTGNRGTDQGGQMKATGNTTDVTGLWTYPNTGASNSSYFTGLPGSFRNSDNTESGVGDQCYYWCSTLDGSDAWYRGLYYNHALVHRNKGTKAYGFSVRCVKD